MGARRAASLIETSPDLILGRVAETGDIDQAVEQLVSMLRRSDYSVADLLDDVAAAKSAAEPPACAILDGIVSSCLARTALVHETAIESMLHGFCELDETGRIIYANPALLRLIPDCHGREISSYFGTEQDAVRDCLNDTAHQCVRRFDLETGAESRAVLLEIGSLSRGGVAAYAFITDLQHAEDAARRIHDQARFGVMKLDADAKITYVNAKACSYLRAEPDQLVGLTPLSLIATEEDAARVAEQIALRHEGISTEYDLAVRPLDSAGTIHLRLRSMPEQDAEDNFSGMFVTLMPIEEETTAEAIRAEIAAATDPQELFRAALARLQAVVPFQLATLSVFSGGREFSRLVRAEPPLETRARWIAIPETLRPMASEFAWGPDLAALLIGTEGGQELHDTDAVQEIIERKLASWCALPIGGRKQEAVLSLMHPDADAYDDQTGDKLKKTCIHTAMHAVLRMEAEQEKQFRLSLITRMTETHSDSDLAKLVVRALARFYGWQNVSIFKVNGSRRRFELLDQAQAERDGFLLPADHSQPIAKGYLGMSYIEDRIVIVGDAWSEAFSKVFVEGSGLTRSEMCVPIHVEGKVVWILNVEDQRPNAFKEPDQSRVERLMRELEPSLARTLSSALLDQVIDNVPDGFVITDFDGNILRCNLSAQEMLGGEPIGRPLASFFDEGSEGAYAAANEINLPVKASLKSGDGAPIDVLIRTRTPRDEYERRVVILQDRSTLNWQAETRTVIDALASVSARARAPLSLASTFVRQIKRSAEERLPHLAEMANHAIDQLARVEITYDQVIGEVTSTSEATNVDLTAALGDAIAGLPPDQAALIEIEQDADIPTVWVDPQQLSVALKSMFAFMLRVGDIDAPVSVRLRAYRGACALSLAKPPMADERYGWNDAPGGERQVAITEAARARAALDEPGLIRFASANRGLFRRRRNQGAETLRLILRAGD